MSTRVASPRYLTVTNAFAALRLLPMSDRYKDTEILALRLSGVKNPDLDR
ncbi:hypothetical protein NGB36_24250 [Streptomyces sp. RB6PN25]|uniref:Uncharacterized protein n=1 Tax=Streptomyces humicola TaxID=2953240 RepID=A0ABT1Q110_9ACTN|nr:hypothetical protein [Streptomyces humicola]MCQ4083626.1 hypothetical protein [Streptomyces humicola]